MRAWEGRHDVGPLHESLTGTTIGLSLSSLRACLLLARVGDGPLLSEGTLKVFVAFAIGGLLGGEQRIRSAHTMQRQRSERRSLAA